MTQATIYAVDMQGNYIGAFVGVEPRVDYVSVPYPPQDARDVWDGNGYIPAPPPVPQSVSRAQGKAALIQAGLWSAVVAYVDAMTDPTDKALAEVALNDTTEWLRTSPFLNQAATALGMTEQDLDNLFIQAAQIQL